MTVGLLQIANSGSGFSSGWQILKLGAGGFITGMDIANDGTQVCRCDTHGAWIRSSSSGQWSPLVTANSMPMGTGLLDDGVLEIRIAPSNSQYLYMLTNGNFYSSSNKGVTWTKQSLTYNASYGIANGQAERLFNYKMAVDPNNPNIVIVGTPGNGAYISSDYGVTWSSISAVGTSTQIPGGYYPGHLVAFDGSSTIYISTYGTGVYVSTNSGSSWSLTSSTPTTHQRMMVDQNHNLWFIDNSSTYLMKYVSGTGWSTLSGTGSPGTGVYAVAVDPFNGNHIVLNMNNGSNTYVCTSTDGGSTWSGTNFSTSFSSTDIPWLSTVSQLFPSNFIFDPTSGGSGTIWCPNGIGVASCSNPLIAGTTAFIDSSAAIEQLVSRDIIAPAGGKPIVAVEDQGVFPLKYNNTTYPSYHYPGSFTASWQLAYAPNNPAYIAVNSNFGADVSGYSADYGQTWTQFSSSPGVGEGGGLAVYQPTPGSTSTTQIVFLGTSTGGSPGPVYSHDSGSTWSACSGLPGTGWQNNLYVSAHLVTVDVSGNFYILNGTDGIYKSTDGGATWSLYDNSLIYGYQSSLECTPGQTGDLWLAPWSGGNPATLYHLVDNGSSITATSTSITTAYYMGFGATKPGGAHSPYPTVYVYDGSAIQYSTDIGSTWTSIGGPNSLNVVSDINGDMNYYGVVYAGFQGSGYQVYSP